MLAGDAAESLVFAGPDLRSDVWLLNRTWMQQEVLLQEAAGPAPPLDGAAPAVHEGKASASIWKKNSAPTPVIRIRLVV